MNVVVLGLTITSSWGNGHATTYRSLLSEFAKRGHKILFLERDVPWYSKNRDMPVPAFCKIGLYSDFRQLQKYHKQIKAADFVIVGSYVNQGVEIGQWITDIAKKTAFYDIDTPVTMRKLKQGQFEYLSPELIARYDLYLSFTGGPILKLLENEYASPAARALFCSADTNFYFPEIQKIKYDLGYIGTYSHDRQTALKTLLIDAALKFPAGRFIVAGPKYPDELNWPGNVIRIEHLAPSEHRKFYNSQYATLNVTRSDMVSAGFSPSVRLFEAAACGTCIISDFWDGLDSIFEIGKEIIVCRTTEEVLNCLQNLPTQERKEIGMRARRKVLMCHTAAHRAEQLEGYLLEISNRPVMANTQIDSKICI